MDNKITKKRILSVIFLALAVAALAVSVIFIKKNLEFADEFAQMHEMNPAGFDAYYASVKSESNFNAFMGIGLIVFGLVGLATSLKTLAKTRKKKED